jgi:hypothetical protein
MAQWMTPTEEQRAGFMEWRTTRPKVVQDLIDRFPPWTLFMIKDTRHRCTIYSYNEDGTLTVSITGQFNLINFGRRVFGIHPDDLVECDLPHPDELLGITFTEEQTLDLINSKRIESGLNPLTQQDLDAYRDEARCAVGDEEGPQGEGPETKA